MQQYMIKTALLSISIALSMKMSAVGFPETITDAQTGKDTVQKSIAEEEAYSDYPLFAFGYVISSPQSPTSRNYDLEGITTLFSIFNAKANLGWHLDKNKEKSVILASLGYSFLNTNTSLDKSETNRIRTEIPEYIHKVSDIHNLYLEALFNQKLQNQWEIATSFNISLSSELSRALTNDDFNINMWLYVQKKLRNFKLGAGYVGYILGDRPKGIPLGYASYIRGKAYLEIIAPILFAFRYRTNDKTFLMFKGELDFNGYTTVPNNQGVRNTSQPDYCEITNLQFRFSYDREFIEKLHWNLGAGYYYRNISFLEGNKVMDDLVFSESLFISLMFYCTF